MTQIHCRKILFVLMVVAAALSVTFVTQNENRTKKQHQETVSIPNVETIPTSASDAPPTFFDPAQTIVSFRHGYGEINDHDNPTSAPIGTEALERVAAHYEEMNGGSSGKNLIERQDIYVAGEKESLRRSPTLVSSEIGMGDATPESQIGLTATEGYDGYVNLGIENRVGEVLLASPKPPRPDLAVTSSSYVGQPYLHGDTFPATITVANTGDAAVTESFTLQMTLSTDRSWDNGNDYVIATENINGLALDGGLIVPMDGVISASVPDGFYYVGVMIDPANSIRELHENNNVWWSSSADVEVASLHAQWIFDPPSATHTSGSAENGSFIVNDTQGLDLPWTAHVPSSSSDWITLDSSYSSGVGSGGEVRYSIGLNDSGMNRVGGIGVEDASFMVVQNAHPPLAPICIDPYDGQDNVERNPTLVWVDGGYSLSYEILFGTDTGALSSVAQVASNGATNEFQTGIRDAATPYRWQIVAWNEGGSTTGAVWRFSTVASPTIEDATDNRLAWSTSGDVPWFSQTTTTHDGEDAMQSGAIGHNQSSTLETTVEGPGSVSFWWKADTEAGRDVVECYLGDTLMGTISGDQDWVQTSFNVPFGTQTLRWIYRKDASGSVGEDCCWLDQVSWNSGTTFTFPVSGYEGRWVAAYLWDHTNQSWIFLEQTRGPTEIVVDNVKPEFDRWYWLCIMVYNNDTGQWELDHGSWINGYEEW